MVAHHSDDAENKLIAQQQQELDDLKKKQAKERQDLARKRIAGLRGRTGGGFGTSNQQNNDTLG